MPPIITKMSAILSSTLFTPFGYLAGLSAVFILLKDNSFTHGENYFLYGCH